MSIQIIALIPYFRESQELLGECMRNVALYADGAVVCVNDCYNKDVEEMVRSFHIVKKLAFVNKDRFSDAIMNSSLLTMAQELQPDWIVKQDVDEEFEPRVEHLKDLLATTQLDLLAALCPSCVQDRNHHCYYQHEWETGVWKPIIFRFDLTKLYVRAGDVHSNLATKTSRSGVVDLRLFHKNLLKSDQENFTKFVLSGRERTGDPVVSDLRRTLPEVLATGSTSATPTFTKRARDSERLLKYSFVDEGVSNDLEILCTTQEEFNRHALGRYLSRLYPTQDAHARMHLQRPTISISQRVRKLLRRLAHRYGWLRWLRDRYRRRFPYRG